MLSVCSSYTCDKNRSSVGNQLDRRFSDGANENTYGDNVDESRDEGWKNEGGDPREGPRNKDDEETSLAEVQVQPGIPSPIARHFSEIEGAIKNRFQRDLERLRNFICMNSLSFSSSEHH